MSNTIKILIVEDNDDQFKTYQDAADELNDEDKDVKFELVRKKSASDAKDALLSKAFDGAIVDLNLTQGNPDDTSGNEVLLEIIESHRFPVLVVSGHLGALDVKIRKKESTFLNFFDRDKPNAEIFKIIKQMHSTGITQILGGRGQIEKKLSEIFWKHLACDFHTWKLQKVEYERTLLRYTVSHLAEYLDIPDGEQKYYHEAEFYIKPPIREHIATGDIVELGENRFIVLSPPCDIAIRNVTAGKPEINTSKIMMAPLVRINKATFLAHGLIKSGDNSSSKESLLNELIKGQRDKYVFLPAYMELYASIVDLQNIDSVNFDIFLTYNRLATVSSMFMKDIQSRFSAYYGRQGQPDMNKKKLVKECKTLLA